MQYYNKYDLEQALEVVEKAAAESLERNKQNIVREFTICGLINGWVGCEVTSWGCVQHSRICQSK